ncbi:MAG: serine protease [Pseudomonadota bacterium]
MFRIRSITRLRGLALGVVVSLVAFAQAPLAKAADPRELVIMLTAKTEAGRDVYGSGIIVGADATHIFIATADHNVFNREALPLEQYRDISVRFSYRGGQSYPAEYVGISDINNDLTALKVRRDTSLRLPKFEISSRALTASAYIGEAVVGVGHPSWQMPASGDFVIDRDARNLIVVKSSAIREGFSGGGLFDASGRDLIGMIIETNGREATVLPAQFVGAWFERHRMPLRVAGLATRRETQQVVTTLDKWDAGETIDIGLQVSRIVNPGSDGNIQYEVLDSAGNIMSKIRNGDRIEKINHKSIPPTFNWERDVLNPLAQSRSGVTFSVRRNGMVFVTRCEHRSSEVRCR